MKRKIIASLLVLAMAGSLLAGCGNKASDSGSSDGSKSSKSSASELKGDSSEKYYMCVPISGVEYWYPVFQGMKEAANALGVQAYYMGTPEWDSSAQADVFNQIMALDPTGILLHPTDGDAFVDPINSAIADDVQVVTFAADSPDSNRTAYVTSDNNKEGSTAAKEVAEEIGGKGSILVMRNPGQTNHETRDDAFISYINENYPDIKIYEENSGQNADATYTAVMTTYQKDANLKAVFTPEASSAVGAAQAGLEIGMALDPTGILVHPTTAEAFVDPINSAIADDVQIVTFAADAPDSERTAYVTSDNTKEGNRAAQEIGEALGGEGSVLVMRNPGQTNHENRDNAFIAYMEENYPDITIYEENSGQDADATNSAVMTTYQKDANLKAVFTPEASSAVGAAQAGLEIGGGSEQALLCACCDTSEEVLDLLKADQFFFAIAPDQYLQGYMSMLNCYFAAHNEILHPMNGREAAGENLWQTPYMDNSLSIVTKDNADCFYLDSYAKNIGLSGADQLIEPYGAK